MKKAITTLLLILVGFTIFDIFYIRNLRQLEIKEYKPVVIEYNFKQKPNKKETKKQVESLYKTLYWYLELDINHDGLTNIGLRMVVINPNVSPEMYGYVLAHELTHLKYRVGNESWVSFEAFKTLYESGIDELKQSALYYADKVMSGWYCGDYNIGYYILEYLEANNAL